MSVSIRDLAKAAGVSIGTVSRAFRDYKDISEQTKKHILETASRIGYHPNLLAANLSSKKKHYIAYIMAGFLDSDPRDGMAFQHFQGTLKACTEAGIELVTYAIDKNQQKEQSYVAFCKQRNIAGAVISGISNDDVYFNEIAESDFPVVAIDFALDKANQGWVSIDNVQGARDALRHLLDLGRKKPLILAGRDNAEVNRMREEGVALALAEYNLQLLPENHIYGNFDEQDAYRSLKERLQLPIEPPDAVFCFSDLMALGALRAIKESGLPVGRDIALMGFDGIHLCEYAIPRLSTVEQDLRAVGYEAAKLLFAILEGKRGGEHKILPHVLRIRESSMIH